MVKLSYMHFGDVPGFGFVCVDHGEKERDVLGTGVRISRNARLWRLINAIRSRPLRGSRPGSAKPAPESSNATEK